MCRRRLGYLYPPPARVRNDPSPWDKPGRSYVGCVRTDALILRDGLPAEGSQDWWTVDRKLAAMFVQMIGGSLNPTVKVTALRFAHPHNEKKVNALRAIHNGDMPEPEGGCLPRVWQWEHEGQVFWLVELPSHLEYAWRSLLAD